METKFQMFIGLSLFEGILATFFGLVDLTGVASTTEESFFGEFALNFVSNIQALGPFAWLALFFIALWVFLLAYIIKDSINPFTATP